MESRNTQIKAGGNAVKLRTVCRICGNTATIDAEVIPLRAGESISLSRLSRGIPISDLRILMQETDPSAIERIALVDLPRRKAIMDVDGEMLFYWAEARGLLPSFLEGVTLPTITAFSKQVILPPAEDLELRVEGDFKGVLMWEEEPYANLPETLPFMFYSIYDIAYECETYPLPLVGVLFETLMVTESPPSGITVWYLGDEVTIPWERVATSRGTTALIRWEKVPLPRGLETTAGWGRGGIFLAPHPFGTVSLELKEYKGKVKFLHIAGDYE